MATIQMTVNMGMEEHMVYLHSGILLSNQKERATAVCNIINESLKHYVRWKKPDWSGYAFINGGCMTLWKRQNCKARN